MKDGILYQDGHTTISKSSNPLKLLKLDRLNSWIKAKIKETIKYRRLQEEEPDSD